MISERLRTLRQLAERNPAFTEGALRWHVFNAKSNGLDRAIVRVGRRVLIDEAEFSRWLEGKREAA
ncbi:MAG: DNA-binding protein [Anaerolineae bacterium]|nr:DNA-binding protein [Anaerolineae bacterium]